MTDATTAPPKGEPAPLEHPAVERLATSGSLGARVRRGMAWAGGLRVAVQVFRFAGNVALARLLQPSDYGLVAIVTAVNGFASLLTELGLAGAVVHASRLTDRFLSTAFWLNAATGVLLTAAVVLAAEPIASFYGQPQLVPLLRICSLGFTLSMGAIHLGLLQRALRFGRLGMIELIGALMTLVTSLALAAGGAGAASLVIGPVVGTVVTTAGYWYSVGWWPRHRPDRRSMRELWRFSGGLTGFNMVNYWSRNADNLLIGKYASAAALGYYGKAYSLMMLPLDEVSNVISRVMFPALVEVRDDPEQFRRAWLKTVRVALLLSIPFSVGVTVTAPVLVLTLFGPKWVGMTNVLALLAASIPPQIVGRTLGPVFQAKGKTGLQFRLSLISTAATLAAIVIGLNWGIEGVALALLVKKWIAVLMPFSFALRITQAAWQDIYSLTWQQLLASVIAAIIALIPRHTVHTDSPAGLLLLQVAAIAVSYGIYIFCAERRNIASIICRAKRE
jgi:O-antigen/teichoic acid export membrane protein